MVSTLRESKAKLSRLVELASQGEDVLITVRGKVKARLTRVEGAARTVDNRSWIQELRNMQKAMGVSSTEGPSIEQILDEDRADRL